ncbi:AWPM-19-like family protein [Perilla frutescens var. hirtella]|nr:AWPM-19-like family protein [Perilla frutescens var. hirtella]
MDRIVARNMAGPFLFLNLIMYCILLAFASWCLNKYLNAQTNHPSMGGNGATGHFLTFTILAAVLGIVSKIAGGNHLRAWRNHSLASASASSTVAWAVTLLAFGLACKEINVGGWRGWRLRVVEAFVIILAFTKTIYVLLLHSGFFGSAHDDDNGPEYAGQGYGGRGVVSKGGAGTVV